MSTIEEAREQAREAMANFIDKRLDGDCGYGVGEHLADALIADGYSKGPRPITDEMVKEARWAWHAADATTGPGTRMRAALEAAEGARR